MLDKLRKLPVIEIIYILGLNFILFVWSILFFALMTSSYNVNYQSKEISMSVYAEFGVYMIIPAYFYLILFGLSANKLFSKLVYFLKFNTKFRWMMYFLLCVISPTFLLGVLSFKMNHFLFGLLISFVVPLMLIYGCWGLKDKLPLKLRKIYGYMTKVLLTVMSLVMAGLIYNLAKEEIHGVYILTILIAVFLCLSIRIEVITEKIKKYKWHAIPLWASVIYATLWGLRNEWVTYYVLYISVVFLLMLVFEKPLLSWRAKNEELHRETEEYYKSKIHKPAHRKTG